jgi:integrase
MAHIKRITLRSGEVRYEAAYRDPAGKERQRTFRRKTDAERFLTTVEADKLRGEWVDPRLGKVRLGEWADRWRATMANRKPNTLAGYEGSLRVHVIPTFGDMPLAKIDQLQVREWVAGMFAKGSSFDTVRLAKQVLSSMMGLAVESGYVVRNPCAGVKLGKRPRREQRALDELEVLTVAAAMPARHQALLSVLAYGGLRWGEAIALRRRRVDLEQGRLEVVESIAEVEGVMHFGSTKTYETRTVCVPELVRNLLSEHMDRYVKSREPDTLVFTDVKGGPLRVSNFRDRAWRPALLAAGISENVRIHDLRHTCAALLIADGAHPKQIQMHLGHSSIRVTMDVYGHLFPNDMERMAQVRDGRIREACAQLSRTSRGLRPFELGDGGGSDGRLPAEKVVELRGFEPLTS